MKKLVALFCFLLLPSSALAAISPLSLISPAAEREITPLRDLFRDEIVRTNTNLTNQEINRLPASRWERLLTETWTIAPRVEPSLPGPARRIEGLPPTLLETGRRFREIRRIVQVRPEFTLEAYEFFSQCLESTEVIETIRTLCLSHTWALALKNELPFTPDAYPAHWREMAQLTLGL